MELVRTRVPGVGFEEGRGRGRACAMHEKTRTLGHRWPALGNPACSRRLPQSEAWNRVPHVPHSVASSGLPRDRLPPHLWHVPFAASFPTTSAEVVTTFSHTATAVGDVMPRVFGTRTGPRDARLRATIAGFPFLERSLERFIYVAYVRWMRCLLRFRKTPSSYVNRFFLVSSYVSSLMSEGS